MEKIFFNTKINDNILQYFNCFQDFNAIGKTTKDVKSDIEELKKAQQQILQQHYINKKIQPNVTMFMKEYRREEINAIFQKLNEDRKQKGLNLVEVIPLIQENNVEETSSEILNIIKSKKEENALFSVPVNVPRRDGATIDETDSGLHVVSVIFNPAKKEILILNTANDNNHLDSLLSAMQKTIGQDFTYKVLSVNYKREDIKPQNLNSEAGCLEFASILVPIVLTNNQYITDVYEILPLIQEEYYKLQQKSFEEKKTALKIDKQKKPEEYEGVDINKEAFQGATAVGYNKAQLLKIMGETFEKNLKSFNVYNQLVVCPK